MHQIIHAHVRRHNKKFAPGHWFYDEGPGWICADASMAKDGKWHLNLHYSHPKKLLPEKQIEFNSLEEAKKFLAEHFECRVIDGKLPPPDM